MSAVLDIVLVGLLVICTLIGARRGLVRSAFRFLGTLAAACASSVLGKAAADWIYGTLFRPAIIERVDSSLTQAANNGTMPHLLDNFPDFMVRALAQAGITEETLQSQMTTQIDKAAETVANAIAPALTGLLKTMAVIVIFMLLMVVVRMAVSAIAAVFRVPILNGVNKLLGGVFSFLTALVFLWAALALVQLLLPVTTSEMQAQVQALIGDSVAAKALWNFNPFSGMFSL